MGLSQYKEAADAYKKGLEVDPSNETLKSGLADASRPRGPSSNPFVEAFQGEEMWAKLTADPGTRVYLQQPDFVKTMQEIQKNPNNLNLYMKDKRVMQALGVLLSVKFGGAKGEDTEMKEAEPVKKVEPEPEPEPEPMELTEEEREKKERKEEAKKEKEQGNAAYKKKEFEKAIEHYSKAMELDDEDISYLTNRAAVYLEMGKVLALTSLHVQFCLLLLLSLCYSVKCSFLRNWLYARIFRGRKESNFHELDSCCAFLSF